MSQIEYEPFDVVAKRIKDNEMTSSSQIIRRAINGYYSGEGKRGTRLEITQKHSNPASSLGVTQAHRRDVYIHENGIEEKLDDAK